MRGPAGIQTHIFCIQILKPPQEHIFPFSLEAITWLLAPSQAYQKSPCQEIC